MKETLLGAGKIIATIVLAILGFFLYHGYTIHLIRQTHNPYDLQQKIFVVGLFVGLVVYFYTEKKIIKRIGLGVLLFALPLIIHLVFYLNRTISLGSFYEVYAVEKAFIYDEVSILEIRCTYWENRINATQEVCFAVDSVHVKNNRGLFGMKTITNDVKIVESNNCSHAKIDSLNLNESLFEVGHELAVKRCFSGAIDSYSDCLKHDISNYDCYYHRGLMYLLKKEYKKALFDFYSAAFIKYNTLENNTIQDIEPSHFYQKLKKEKENVKSANFDGIFDLLEDLKHLSDFEDYLSRINFCLEKLNVEN